MNEQIRQIRRWMIFFMITLFLSGLTAIPIKAELNFVSKFFSPDTVIGGWLELVTTGVNQMSEEYPFLAYGYDWLAFAHFTLAILFIGPYRDPVKNKWVIEFGMISCLLIIPYAMTAGHFRDIPFWWRLIDCSFGLIGLIPLGICYQKIIRLERLTVQEANA